MKISCGSEIDDPCISLIKEENNQTMLKKLTLVLTLLLLASIPILGIAGCTRNRVNMPVVLLTDFGSADYGVSQLKGIIYSNNPEAKLIDASNDVPAFDVPTGAFILDAAAREFPPNSVFVGIIDPYSQKPGVRYLVLTTNRGQVFVLPDNGLLTYVIRDMGIKTVYQITNQKLFDKPIEELSAERIQGKIAALLASGYPPQDVGTPLAAPRTLDIQEPVIVNNKLLGTVVYIDSFGNGVTNVVGKTANEFGLKPGDTIEINIGQSKISARLGTIYSDVPKGKEIVFVNKNLDKLELSINLGNFAKTYNIKAGAKFEIGR